MDCVALRVVTSDGRLRTALAAIQLERTDDYVALAIPVGSPGFSRHGIQGGPRGSFLLPDRWEPGLHPRPWRNRDVVMIHRFCDEWSTWRWLDERRAWTSGAYVNVERYWTVGPASYDTDDLTLDVVVLGDGSVGLKDEDELAWAEREQVYTAEQAARIRGIGGRALEHFGRGGWPLGVDWDRWLWSTSVGLPSLPDCWDTVSSTADLPAEAARAACSGYPADPVDRPA